ncbi:ATP-binding protein [Sphaerisporangium fuscum]|uniref:ATP-binding protein n=1 Tax=Sphaerisporangium fuscum TaxID=2835868 RepID=UPI001BDC6BCE|nr:ATP-binding protein [Sphaerisporangium fuscum]
MIGTPGGYRAMSCEIPSDRVVVSKVRDMVRWALTGWGLPELVDDVVLMVSELVTNAIAHGAPPIRLSLRAGDGALRGEVTDHGEGLPHRLHVGDEVDHGRGLLIVDALADRWGVSSVPERAGKGVWFVRFLAGGEPEAG